MNTKNLIGRTIEDILFWSEMEDGGLDVAKVFIKLDNSKIIGVPSSFQSEDLIETPPEDAESLFVDLSDYPIYHVNPEKKSIQDIIDAKKKRDSSLLGRIKSAFGIVENIPREYIPYEIEYKENKMKYLQNQKIVDLIEVNQADSLFLELENGYIITEVTVAPNGTGNAGLHFFESLTDFEDGNGKEYIRFKKEIK